MCALVDKALSNALNKLQTPHEKQLWQLSSFLERFLLEMWRWSLVCPSVEMLSSNRHLEARMRSALPRKPGIDTNHPKLRSRASNVGPDLIDEQKAGAAVVCHLPCFQGFHHLTSATWEITPKRREKEKPPTPAPTKKELMHDNLQICALERQSI